MKKTLLSACLAFVLTGCGGGGGGGDDASQQIDILGSDLYTPAFATTESVLLLGRVSADAFLASEQNGFTRIDDDCEGDGSRIVEYVDNDTSGGVSAGDQATLTYTNCNDPVFDAVVNGAIVLEVGSVASAADVRNITFNTSFQSFRVSNLGDDIPVVGGFQLRYSGQSLDVDQLTIAATDDTLRVSLDGSQLTLLSGSQLSKSYDLMQQTYQFSFDASLRIRQPDVDVRLNILTLGATSTDVGHFTGTINQFPDQGVARLTIPGSGSQCLLAGNSQEDSNRSSPDRVNILFSETNSCATATLFFTPGWQDIVDETLFSDNDSFDLRTNPVISGDNGDGMNDDDSSPPRPNLPEQQAMFLDIDAEELAYDPVSGLVYATAGSQAAETGNANSIVAIDPTTGQVVASEFAGSEPSQIAVSDDGKYAYVGFAASSQIKRFLLPGLQEDITINLPNSRAGAPTHAGDLAVAPGQSQTLAVVVDQISASGGRRIENVVIFDDATARPVTLQNRPSGLVLAETLAWSADANTLYAKPSSSVDGRLFVFDIDNAGLTFRESFDSAVSGFQSGLQFADGLLYLDSGVVANPDTGARVGNYDTGNPNSPSPIELIADVGLNRVFGAFRTSEDADNIVRLVSFDRTRFVALQTVFVEIGQAEEVRVPVPDSLVRWGEDGLVFIVDEYDESVPIDGRVVLTQGDFVSGTP